MQNDEIEIFRNEESTPQYKVRSMIMTPTNSVLCDLCISRRSRQCCKPQ